MTQNSDTTFTSTNFCYICGHFNFECICNNNEFLNDSYDIMNQTIINNEMNYKNYKRISFYVNDLFHECFGEHGKEQKHNTINGKNTIWVEKVIFRMIQDNCFNPYINDIITDNDIITYIMDVYSNSYLYSNETQLLVNELKILFNGQKRKYIMKENLKNWFHHFGNMNTLNIEQIWKNY